MTVAPPFLLVGIIICVGFLVITLVPGVFLLWLGKKYRSFKIIKPFRAIYLTALIAFIARLVIAAPQIYILSKTPLTRVFIPPYLFFFFIFGFIIFSRAIDGDTYGKKEAIIAGGISLVCVLWYLLIEFLVYASIT